MTTSTTVVPGRASVVILNWNGGAALRPCLQSVLDQDHGDVEILLVDNGSTDDSVASITDLAEANDHVTVYEVGENTGFARGMNYGIARATGEFVMPMGFDVVLDTAHLRIVADRFALDDQIGVIGGSEFILDGETRTDDPAPASGRLFLRKSVRGVGAGPLDRECFGFGVTGSFPVFRRSFIEDMSATFGHVYDESFVTGWEDMELWWRARARAWKVLFHPAAKAWHVGSGSVGGKRRALDKPLDYQVRVFRNRKFLALQSFPDEVWRKVRPAYTAMNLAMPGFLLLRSRGSLKAWYLASKEVSAAKPMLEAKRRTLIDNLRVEPEALLENFRDYADLDPPA
jgi:GT2 family glycosyltransferase